MSPKATAGYSGTLLAKKLGIKTGFRLWACNPPTNYIKLLAPLPEDVAITTRSGKDLNLIHLFTKSRRELATVLPRMMKNIKKDGAIWISWPKKASKIETDVTEDGIRLKYR